MVSLTLILARSVISLDGYVRLGTHLLTFDSAPAMARPRTEDLALENFARYREFLEYHRLLGVQHFYVYDNAVIPSEQMTPELRWYIERGLVTYVPWFCISKLFSYPIAQSTSYNHVIQAFGHLSTWMIQVCIYALMCVIQRCMWLDLFVWRVQIRLTYTCLTELCLRVRVTSD